MKLASLNCPNCNAPLRQEGDNYVCTACGSAFTMDYDESDVEYERLRTEADRERIKAQRDIELMATKMRLEEESQIRRQNYARKQVFGSLGGSLFKMILIPIAIMFFMSIASVAFFLVLRSSRSHLFKQKTTATTWGTTVATTTENITLTTEQILGDSSFVENALASGMSYVKTQHTGEVYDWNLMKELDLNYVPTAQLQGEPHLYGVYLLNGPTQNYFMMLYSLDYTYVETEIDRVTTVYCAVYLAEMSVNDDGTIANDYIVWCDNGEGKDLHFFAYYDAEQMYREAVLGKNADVIDLTSDLVK